MIVSYRFSSPAGDIPVKPEDLSLPFKIDPAQEHPFLTLRDYFQAIESFICNLSFCNNIQNPEGDRATWTLVLAEWYENYHEWHFAPGKGREGRKIRLWDHGKGYRWLTKREGLELYEKEESLELSLIRKNLVSHGNDLYRACQTLPS